MINVSFKMLVKTSTWVYFVFLCRQIFVSTCPNYLFLCGMCYICVVSCNKSLWAYVGNVAPLLLFTYHHSWVRILLTFDSLTKQTEPKVIASQKYAKCPLYCEGFRMRKKERKKEREKERGERERERTFYERLPGLTVCVMMKCLIMESSLWRKY